MDGSKLFFCGMVLMGFLLLRGVWAQEAAVDTFALLTAKAQYEGDTSIAAHIVEQGSSMQYMHNIVTFCCNHSYVLSGIGLAFFVGSSLHQLYEYCRNYSAQQCHRPVVKPVVLAEIDSVDSPYGIDV